MKARPVQLNKFQENFKELMLDHPKALDESSKMLSDALDGKNIPLPARLKVYRNNIIGSLTDVMLASFPIIKTLVGEEFLTGMARTFILQNPPQQGCLNTYGQGFAEFIENFEPAKSLPYLGDVARLEIALNDSYYARDEAAFNAEDLAKIAPKDIGDLKLSLCDHVALLSSPYPLRAIHDFCLSGTQDGTLDLDQGGVLIMIARKDLETHIVSLEAAEYDMLCKISEGKTLGEAVMEVLDTHQDFNFQVFLEKHISLETFLAMPSNT